MNKEGELTAEATCRDFRQVRPEGKLPQSASISRVYLLHETVVVSKMEIVTAHGAMPDKAQTKLTE